MSLANVGSAATTWSWHPHQDASLTKPPRLSRSTFYYTRPGRSAEYNSETVKADATYRSYADSRKEFTLSWLDNCPCDFTMYILKHSNSSNYCIYIVSKNWKSILFAVNCYSGHLSPRHERLKNMKMWNAAYLEYTLVQSAIAIRNILLIYYIIIRYLFMNINITYNILKKETNAVLFQL